MLINQEITDNLHNNIDNINWMNFCDDPAKYASDVTYQAQVKADMITKFENDIGNYVDKVITPFSNNGFHCTLDKEGYGGLSANVCKIYYIVRFSENENVNPFEARVKIFVSADEHNGTEKYQWSIENPVRIYFKRYLNWGSRSCCNHQLFTRRGFAKYGYQRYVWEGTIDSWTDKAKDLCDKLKKTIKQMECEHEKLQKGVQLKKKELSIQSDEVSCMLSELNATFKPANVKFLFNGDCKFDYVDSPIRFNIVCSNNPEQKDENLYVIPGMEIEVGEHPCDVADVKAYNQYLFDNRMKLFSQMMNKQTGYYRSHISLSLVYRPTDDAHWYLEINYPTVTKIVEELLDCKAQYECRTLDEIKDTITTIFKKDNSLFDTVEAWKNGTH